jgi:putative DNA primase
MAYQYKKGNSQSSSDKAVEAFAEMIISRLEEVKASEWKKGWIGGKGFQGIPQNLNGRTYSGTNSLFLFMHTAINNYAAPIYLTFLQKEKEGLRLNKGAKAMPVVYWDWNIKDARGEKVSLTDYRNMSKEEREHCEVRPFLRSFRVYNIDQTNMKEVNKEKYEKLVAQFQSTKVTDTQGMYKNAALDRMFEYQEWLCKIHCDKPSDRAFFSPTHDFIVIPQKEQFKIGKTESDIYKDGMEYYSTALHEMTHSTGTAERLNRNMEGRYGDPKYAKEELVAELSAAMVGNSMGFDKRITDNNAAYIDSWLHTLREEPRFIMSVMSDVNKASHLILEKIDEQKLALGEKPILNISRSDSEKSSITAGIYKQPTGNYVVRASVDGQELEPKPIDNKTAVSYLKISDNSQKDKMLSDIVKKHYGEELSMPKVSQHISQGLKI